MKKKIFPLLLTLSLLSSCSPFDQNLPSFITSTSNSNTASTSTIKQTPLFSYVTLDNNEIKITKYNPKTFVERANAEIPEIIDGKKVTVIGTDVFKDYTSLIYVSIPSSITEIEKGAFKGCIELSELTLPSSLKRINDEAFYNCSSLQELTLPDSIEYLGNYVFTNCSSLTKINIPENENITKISNYLFSGCQNLESIIIPSNIKNISSHAFYNCQNLTSVDIPNNIFTIGNSAFANCYQLNSIDLKETLQTIENSAFANCTNLKTITFPKDTIIAKDAFSGCNITDINLSDLITTIDNDTLDKYLSTITSSKYQLFIPKSVTTIDLKALNNHEEITAIEVDEENENYSSVDGILYDKNQTTLLKCPIAKTSIYEIPDTVLTVKENSFYNCNKLEIISLPKGVTKVENNAFLNCSNLKSIQIPLSVVNMGRSFEGCTSMIIINCEAPKKPYDWNEEWNYSNTTNSISVNWNSEQNSVLIDGIYYTLEGEDKHYVVISNYQDDEVDENLELESEVLIYGKTYPVKEIKKGAFYNCDSIKTIMLGDNLETINEKVFEECSNLEAIIFPNTIKVMNSTFLNCNSLKIIYLEASNTNGFVSNFNEVSSSKTVTVKTNFKPITTVSNNVSYTFNENYQVSVSVATSNKNSISSSITLLDNFEFDGVSYPVTEILDNAFSSCTRLNSIILPTYLQKIGNNAFSRTSLTTITIGDYVNEIKENVFKDCPNLKSILVSNSNDTFISENDALYQKSEDDADYRLIKCPEGKTGTFVASNKCNEIDAYAFYNCINLTSVEISRTSIEVLNESTFENCSSIINTIRLPNTLKAIKANVFKNCSSSTFNTLTLPDNLEELDLSALDMMDNLKSITIATDNTTFTTIDGVLYNFQETELLKCPQAYSGKLTLPSTLTTIDSHALIKTINVTAFEIIDNDIFFTPSSGLLYNTDKTEVIYCPRGIEEFTFESTTKSIQEGAFDNCEKLTTLRLIPSITTIPTNAFKTCTSLANIYINQTAFNNLSDYYDLANISTLIINADVTSKPTYGNGKNPFDLLKEDVNIIIANGNNNFQFTDGALIYRYSSGTRRLIKLVKNKVGSYIIPSNVTAIDYDAFKDTKLERLYIPNSVSYIYDCCFAGNTELEIYTSHTQKPNSWYYNWLKDGPDESKVHWGVSSSDFPA